jgi:hypothetical protein
VKSGSLGTAIEEISVRKAIELFISEGEIKTGIFEKCSWSRNRRKCDEFYIGGWERRLKKVECKNNYVCMDFSMNRDVDAQNRIEFRRYYNE